MVSVLSPSKTSWCIIDPWGHSVLTCSGFVRSGLKLDVVRSVTRCNIDVGAMFGSRVQMIPNDASELRAT